MYENITYIHSVSLERQIIRQLVRVTSYGVDIVEQHRLSSNSNREKMDGSV